MPSARRTDPSTSHEAAQGLTPEALTETQAAILKLLTVQPMTDDNLLINHSAGAATGRWRAASDSGIRSRRSELVSRGLITEVDRAKTRFNRAAIVWGLR